MRRRFVDKRYYMKDFLDVQIYTEFSKAKKGKRRKKFRPTSETQKKLNELNREKELDRKVHANFTRNDFCMDLTYSVQPESEKEAQLNIKNFFRRVQRIYAAAGKVLKYVYITERGTKSGRYHHHIFISGGVSRDELEEAWLSKKYAGRCNCDRLQFTKTGVSDRVYYVLGRKEKKQGGESIGYRKWSGSKNLVKPKEKSRSGYIRLREVESLFADPDSRTEWERLYPGYIFAQYTGCYYNEINGGYYLSCRMYKKGAKIIDGRV